MNSSPSSPLLSVVVIGRNESARLRDCFTSIKNIQHPSFELEALYVDSGSTDNSLAIAEEFGIRSLPLTPELPTAALGRNAGWRASRGQFILFIDGDSAIEPDFVINALPWFDDPTLAVIFGRRRERYPERTIFNRVLDLDWQCDFGPAPFCGGDAIFRRAAIEVAGGYDEHLIAGEEPDLCRRLRDFGFYVRCIDVPMSTHDLAMRHWSQYLKRSLRTGHAFAEVAARYNKTSDPIWTAECRHNFTVATVQLIVVLATLISAIALRSLWPFAYFAAAAIILTLNTMWRRSYMTRNRYTLFLYSIHGHLQQVPIAIGQIAWHLSRKRPQHLIEYK